MSSCVASYSGTSLEIIENGRKIKTLELIAGISMALRLEKMKSPVLERCLKSFGVKSIVN